MSRWFVLPVRPDIISRTIMDVVTDMVVIIMDTMEDQNTAMDIMDMAAKSMVMEDTVEVKNTVMVAMVVLDSVDKEISDHPNQQAQVINLQSTFVLVYPITITDINLANLFMYIGFGGSAANANAQTLSQGGLGGSGSAANANAQTLNQGGFGGSGSAANANAATQQFGANGLGASGSSANAQTQNFNLGGMLQ